MAELIQGVGERITAEENERRRRAASPEAMNNYAAQTYPVKKKPEAAQPSGAASNPLEWFQDNVLYPERKAEFEAQRSADKTPKPSQPKAKNEPFVSGRDRGPLPAGEFTGPLQRYRSDGKGGETPVNVVRKGQVATLGGKRVVADGQGGWRDNTGSLIGNYRPGEDRTAVPKPMADLRGSETPGSMTPAAATEEVIPPENPPLPSEDPKGIGDGSDPRVSAGGVVQKGRTLGGVNNILKGFGAGELADVSTAYQSEALPATLAGVTQLEKPLVEGANPTQKPDVSQPFQQDPQLQASFPEGTKPFASTDKYTPYSTGGNPQDPQDGSSSEPDRVERIRQLAFEPKGARQKEVSSRKAVRGNFGGDEPDTSTLVSPTQSNPMRNQIRDIYGDTSLTIAQQSAKVSALTGVYRYGGEGYANVGGKLVPAKDGSGRSLLNARGAGLDPTKYLNIPETETPAYKPDVSGQSKSVQEAVSLTAPPTSLSTELDLAGPKVDPTEFLKSFNKKIGLTK